MIYKNFFPDGSIRYWMRYLKFGQVDQFQDELCNRLGVKSFFSFYKKKPESFPLERYKIIREVFFKYGIDIESKEND